ALRKLGLPAGSVLHIGDSQVEDVAGARAAGLRTLHLDRAGRGELFSMSEAPRFLS
ncbi:MAG: HAD hydrolase-like protein, partial [Pedosphaera parvula]|nr:HAD hydrolase-like protein [Pedosphaera parvula]